MPTARGHAHLPTPWLCQLIEASEPSSRLSLARTCKELWNLVLFSSNHVELKMNPFQDQEGKRSATCLRLLRGCREGADVKLSVRAWPYTDEDKERVQGADEIAMDWECASASEKEAMAASTFWLEALCEQLLGTPGSPLQCVTHLELQGVVLGNLVPSCVVKAFPRLQHLTRRARLHRVTGKPFCPTICPQLHSLTLTGALVDWRDARIATAQLKQQFQALPNLQALTMSSDKDSINPDCPSDDADGTARLWIQSIKQLSKQLSTLDLAMCDRLEAWQVGQLWDVRWPSLTQLKWPSAASHGVQGYQMEKLLKSTPNLCELIVGKFWLSGASFTSAHCSWRHLAMRKYPTLEDLAALPLSGLLTLSIDGLEFCLSHLPLAPAAAANSAHVGRILELDRWGPFKIELGGEPEAEMTPQSFVSVMAQCLVSLRQSSVVIEIQDDVNVDILVWLGGIESLQAQLTAEVRARGMQTFSLRMAYE